MNIMSDEHIVSTLLLFWTNKEKIEILWKEILLS